MQSPSFKSVEELRKELLFIPFERSVDALIETTSPSRFQLLTMGKSDGTLKMREDWSEADHPRDEYGQFTSDGSGMSSSKSVSGGKASGSASSGSSIQEAKGRTGKETQKVARESKPFEKKKIAEMNGKENGLSAKKGQTLGNECSREAQQAYDKARASEPEITNSMRNISESLGWYMHGLENKYLDDNPYSGIYLDCVAQNGQKFELQIHSPESMVVKDKLHPL